MIPTESPITVDDPYVEAWRLGQLIDAGYPVTEAEKLALRADVDLHEAVELVARGCPHSTAVRILL